MTQQMLLTTQQNFWNSQSSFHIEFPVAAIVWFHPWDLQTNPSLADHYQPTETEKKKTKELLITCWPLPAYRNRKKPTRVTYD